MKHLLALAAVVAVTALAAPAAEARNWDRVENRWDRREDRADRREDRRDRREDRRDAREVVLHELAHLAAPDWHHGDRFYRYLYAMAAFDGRLSGTYVMNSERVTAQAAKTAKALGIRGATKAIRDRRAANRANRNVSRPRYVRCTFTDCPFTRSDGRPHTHAENTTIYHRDGRSWHVPMRAEAAA